MGLANFDSVARVYRWAEYVCLGRALERCRYCFLDRLGGCKRAVVLGDGDGRFTARLLAVNATVEVDAVDSSGAMLELMRRRCGENPRLRTHLADALTYEVEGAPDLVVAHFFFDCFGQAEVDGLVGRIAEAASPGGGLGDFGFSGSGWGDALACAGLYSGAVCGVRGVDGFRGEAVAGFWRGVAGGGVAAGGGAEEFVWGFDDGGLGCKVSAPAITAAR